MKTQTNNRLFYRLGKSLGLPVAWILRKQQNWLVKKGVTPQLARWLATFINLLVLAALLLAIVPIWIMLLVVILAFLAHNGADVEDLNVNPFEHEEWRMGWDGYGLYNSFDARIDGGSIDDED